MTTMTATPPASLAQLLAFLAQDPANVTLRKDAIGRSFDAGEWTAAKKLIDDGLARHPRDPGLLALCAFSAMQAQRFGEAEQALGAAIASGLEAPEPRYNLAFAVAMQGRFADALRILDTPGLLAAVPLAHLLRARCLHHLQRPEEAIAECHAHLASDPGRAETHGLLALLLQEGARNKEAEAHITAALRVEPRQLDAMLALAGVQADAQDLDGASATFDALLQAHPKSGRGWHGLAMIEFAHMRLDAARTCMEHAAGLLPLHIGTWHALAWIHLMQADVAAADRAFRRALAVDRNFGETHGGLAVVAALADQEDEARACIRRALRLNPQCMSVQYAELLLLRRKGRIEEARAVLERFMQRPAPGGDILFRDLVAAHIRYTEARGEGEAGSAGLH